MFSKEKNRIRLNLLLRNFLYHSLFWIISMFFFVFLSGYEDVFTGLFRNISFTQIHVKIIFSALSIAFLFTISDLLFSDRIMRFAPIRLILILRSLLYFSIGAFLLILSSHTVETLYNVQTFEEIQKLLPKFEKGVLRFMVYFFMSCYLNTFLKEMVKKVGKGNFRNWVLGFMNKPREEERIFMFIDMKDSTTIAERFKHKKFSHLVQDVFNDMAIVDNYQGQIYQYLGDGAIISWYVNKGLKNNNFLNAFFAFTELVEKRSRYYSRKYGLKPKFKAGLHVGKTMVLQVGRIRRDISYNGDALNTTARIEGMCNTYKQNLLISGDLFDIMLDRDGFVFKNVESVKLKGKRKATEIYAVRKKHVRSKPSKQ